MVRRNYTHRSLPCLCRLCVLAYADTLQVSACHCEERSDVAIRYSLRCNMTESSTLGECVSGYEFAQTAANLLSFSAGKTDCRRCAHWFAMTCRRKDVCAGASTSPHCHCEERSDVAIRYSCGRAWRRAALRANTEKCYGFAQSSTRLPSFTAGRTDCHASVRTGSQ